MSALAIGYAHGCHEGILCAVDRLPVLIEVITCDAMDGGYATCMYGAVADGGIGRDVVDACILAVEALRE